MGHDVDLALLTVEDEEFWVGTEGPMKPLKLGGVPQLQVGGWVAFKGRLFGGKAYLLIVRLLAGVP